MSDFDKALTFLQQDRRDPENQSRFYDLFLNTAFFIPTLDEEAEGEETNAGEPATAKGHATPLVITADEVDYLVLFDTEERLRQWAQAEVPFIKVPGHILATMSSTGLHWALNVGCEPSKQFVPEEIDWLREVVRQCNAEAAEGKTK